MRTVLRLSRLRADAGEKQINWSRLPFKKRGAVFILTALAAVLFLGVALSLLLLDRASNGELSGDSVEAGFARDMIVHHSQAVEMAEIVRDKTGSQQIRILATNISLNQKVEIGRMPGMASSKELGELQKASSEGAGKLLLMVPHHKAAIPMVDGILKRTDRPEFRRLAHVAFASPREESGHTWNVLWSIGVQPDHGSHSTHGVPPIRQETAAGIAHGATQGAAAFLVGLVVFVSLVWLPVTRVVDAGSEATGRFVRCAWALFGLLVFFGVVELSLYAVRASGEPFGLGLLGEAAFETRVGHVWLERICFGLLTAAAMTWAARRPRAPYRWWVATVAGGALLATLTQLSHAAAEEGLLPLLADWFHVVAASAWMGGLLGFPLVLLGPLRTMPAEQRDGLRVRAVRRFSRIAILAVTVIVLTGAYATLLHLPDLSALIGTPYGRALLIKLGMLVLVLAVGGINLMLAGREPFERLIWLELILALGIFVATGFLTSLPPPSNT